MIKNYLQFINENHYLDLSESIKTLNDICYDLKDEGISYYIQPDNEIKVKMLSLSLSGKIEPRNIDFYLKIDTVNRKLTDQVNRSGMFSAPEWFVDVLNRIEDYMSGIGFDVSLTAIYYSGDKEYLDDVSGIIDITGLIKAIRLDFKKTNLNESKSFKFDKLYHATYNYHLPSIKKKGLDTRDVDSIWSDSKKGVVYLSDDPFVAESYAEIAEDIDDEIYDSGIVILEIDLNGLDLSKLKDDENVRSDDPSRTYEYHGVIPFSNISIYGQSNESYNKPRAGGKKRWSVRYKKSIDCNNPKGFSQKQYCKRKKSGGAYKSKK